MMLTKVKTSTTYTYEGHSESHGHDYRIVAVVSLDGNSERALDVNYVQVTNLDVARNFAHMTMDKFFEMGIGGFTDLMWDELCMPAELAEEFYKRFVNMRE